MLRAAALAAAAMVVLAACGSSAPAARHTHQPVPSFTALTLPAACKALRADIVANGGEPDAATLAHIRDHSMDGNLISDARRALAILPHQDHGIAMGLVLGSMGHDCQATGVEIPQ